MRSPLDSFLRVFAHQEFLMGAAEHRLGDLIDDYCPRCRLLLNHAVASLVDAKVVKVICQTCYTEHPYRHGQDGKKKKPAGSRGGLFEQVLAKATPATVSSSDPPTSEASDQKKKKSAPEARYISRHQGRPPRQKR